MQTYIQTYTRLSNQYEVLTPQKTWCQQSHPWKYVLEAQQKKKKLYISRRTKKEKTKLDSRLRQSRKRQLILWI